MTDLERHSVHVRGHHCPIHGEWKTDGCNVCSWLSQSVNRENLDAAELERRTTREWNAMFAALRREGAEEMRERAAKTAESDDWSDVYGWNPVALSIARAIRALPLEPEK